jgi:hypothetical protein
MIKDHCCPKQDRVELSESKNRGFGEGMMAFSGGGLLF